MGCGDTMGGEFDLEGCAQVDDGEILTGIELILEFVRFQPGDSQCSQEALSVDELPDDVSS